MHENGNRRFGKYRDVKNKFVGMISNQG